MQEILTELDARHTLQIRVHFGAGPQQEYHALFSKTGDEPTCLVDDVRPRLMIPLRTPRSRPLQTWTSFCLYKVARVEANGRRGERFGIVKEIAF